MNPNKQELSRWINVLYNKQNNTKLKEQTDERYQKSLFKHEE